MKTIVFDFGNVLAFFDHRRAVRRLAPFTNMLPAQLLVELYGSPLEDAYERGTLTTAEYVGLGKMICRLMCDDATFLAAFVDIFWRNDEVCALIPRLKPRYRLLLASNTNEAHYGRFTEQFADVLAPFDHLCPSHLAGARKPEAAFFEYCQRFAEADPSECLFVDDLRVNVEAARRHGWAGVCYTRPGALADDLWAAGVQLG